jgi:uncharacterized glyoxalase superfamily protein PhnB
MPRCSTCRRFDAASSGSALDTREEVDVTFARLSEGGGVLMGLDAYPFSPRFAWFNDRFGVSWQLSAKPT